MRLRELTDRLDAYFRPEAFDEHDLWSFAYNSDEWHMLMTRASDTFVATCNGFMLIPAATDPPIDRVYLTVFPQPALLDQIVTAERQRGAPGALVFSHHLADFESRHFGGMPIPVPVLDALREANCGFYMLHAPLDCHPKTSTSGALADGLGLRRVATFAPYVNGFAGIIGEQAPEPFGTFAERVRVLCELQSFEPAQVRHAGRPVSRVAVIAGGGDDVDSLREVLAAEVDTYLTGTWWTPQRGEWADQNRAAVRALLPGVTINLLGCSHNGSEQVVLRDQVAALLAGWGVETRLVRQADHWR